MRTAAADCVTPRDTAPVARRAPHALKRWIAARTPVVPGGAVFPPDRRARADRIAAAGLALRRGSAPASPLGPHAQMGPPAAVGSARWGSACDCPVPAG